MLGLTALAGSATIAAAHQMNLSTARITVSADRLVEVEIALRGNDADRVAGTKVFDDRTGLVAADSLARSVAPIAAYILGHAVVIGADGGPCTAGPAAVTPDADGVVIRLAWSCEANGGARLYRSRVLTDIDAAARQVVLVQSGGKTWQSLLDAGKTEVALGGGETPLLGTITRYIGAGIEHIFIGYDHIAFLVAIILWARRIWPVIKIVTAFTLAHSLTLSLAALGIVVIPSAIVEPAIAASIIYVALENFFSRAIEKRWRDTFAFGLIHGFGFAGALQEFGLPRDALVPALASFNIGVEIGQIAIVSLALPVLIGLDRVFKTSPRRAPALVYAVSSGIGLLGIYWLLARTLGA